MKLIFTLFLALFGTSMAFAQLDRQYSFTESSGTYTPVSGGTQRSLFSYNHTPLVLPIGFTFNCAGVNYTNFSMETRPNPHYKCGVIFLGSNPAAVDAPRISALEFNGYDSLAVVTKVEGLAPFRTCIIQYNSIYDGTCWNYWVGRRLCQIRLYETTHVIEFVYGPFAWNSTTDGATCIATKIPTKIGIGKGNDTLMVGTADKYGFNNVALQSGSSYINVLCSPASGKTFQFTPIVANTCGGGPIAGGTTTIADNYVDKGAWVTLQVTGSSNSALLGFQWQQSADSINWTDINGANKPFLTRQVIANGWFRRKTTCEGGGASFYSIPKKVVIKPFYESYCIPAYPYVSSASNFYSTTYGFQITGATVPTSVENAIYYNQPYQRLPATGNTPTVVARGVSIQYKVGASSQGSVRIWMDLNRNGLFEDSELIASGLPHWQYPGRIAPFNYTIPPATDTGLTCIRVRGYLYGLNSSNSSSCGPHVDFGETEDYIIRITANACNSAPTGGTTLTNKTSVCGTDSITLKVTGASGQEGITFQWQQSADSTNWSNIGGATGDSLRTAQNTTTFYRRRIACSTFENFSAPVKVTSIVLQGGTAASTVPTHTCGLGEFAIVVNGGSAGSYQWQQSADSANWVNISGATGAVLTTSATATTFYRRQVNCTGGTAAFSSGAKVTVIAPPGGTAQAADSVNCGSNNILVTVNGGTYNPGLSFQWQSSADGSSWTNISGANTDSLSTVLFADTWYRRQTGCGSFTAFSLPKKVAIKGPLAGQATGSSPTVNCGDSVTLGNTLNIAGHSYQWQQSTDSIAWNNISGATGSAYTARPTGTTWYRRTANCGGLGNTSAPVKVSPSVLDGGIADGGNSSVFTCPYAELSLSVNGGSTGSYQWQLSTDSTNWADIPNATLAYFFYAPQQPVSWVRRKVTCASTGTSAFSVPTKSIYSGPSVTNLVSYPALDTVGCGNTHIQLAAQGMVTGNGITYTWQKSVDSVNWVDIAAPQTIFYIDIYPAVTAYYRCKVSCVTLSTYSNVKKIVVVGTQTPNSTISMTGYPICPGRNFTLYVDNPGDTTNAVYQWQRATDTSINNSNWVNIPGATQSRLTASQTTHHWYRRGMTAACTPGQVFTQPYYLVMNQFYNCYCPPVNTNGCANAAIVHVKVNENAITGGSIVSPSGCSSAPPTLNFTVLPGGYAFFYSSWVHSTTLKRGQTYGAEVRTQSNLSTAAAPWERADVYVDFNRNGTYEASERFSQKLPRTASPSLGTFTINIQVPFDATNGYTGLRVRYYADTSALAFCAPATHGETEDYIILIDGSPLPPVASGAPFNTCVNASTVVIKNSNNNTTTWQKLLDASGAVVAEVNARGNQLDTVKTSVYVNNGPVQQDLNGRFYLNRNVSIQPKVQPSTAVGVRLYLTAAELAALQAVDPQANINNLNITKVGTDCPAQPNSNNTFVVANSAQGYMGNWYLEFDVTSFSSFFMHRGNALAGVLSNWQVQPQGHQNKLSWATATERNLARFEVERSVDSLVFNKIGTVNSQAANGNSANTLSYSFADGSAPTAIVYYRLKIVDRQGGISYSKVLKVMGNNIEQLTIGRLQPNPAGSSTQLTVVSPGNGELQLAIADQTGRTVQTRNVQLVRGENKIILQLDGLAKGVYIVRAVCPEGCSKTTIKLVKQ